MKFSQIKMNFDAMIKELNSQMKIDQGKLSLSFENFIREYMVELERDGVILELSGGIDSAVVASLCKKAVGSEKVLDLIMPQKDTKKENGNYAVDYAKELNIEARLVDISPYLEKLNVYIIITVK